MAAVAVFAAAVAVVTFAPIHAAVAVILVGFAVVRLALGRLVLLAEIALRLCRALEACGAVGAGRAGNRRS